MNLFVKQYVEEGVVSKLYETFEKLLGEAIQTDLRLEYSPLGESFKNSLSLLLWEFLFRQHQKGRG
jgi:hypothetical protein